MVLNWHENVTDEDMPPMWMWPLEHELVRHFEEVDRKRKEKYGGKETLDPEDDGVMSNELAAARR